MDRRSPSQRRVDDIRELIRSLEPPARRAAHAQLRSLESSGVRSLAGLETFCADERAPATLRGFALWALSRLAGKKAARVLLTALGDPDPGVRAEAARHLGEIQSRRSIDRLARVLTRDPDARSLPGGGR